MLAYIRKTPYLCETCNEKPYTRETCNEKPYTQETCDEKPNTYETCDLLRMNYVPCNCKVQFCTNFNHLQLDIYTHHGYYIMDFGWHSW